MRMSNSSPRKACVVRYAWPLAALVAVAAMLVSFIILPAFFPTNDDTYIKQILSGGVSVEPNPYVMFVNYGLCSVISGLYLLAPGLPWWVMTHLFLLFLTISLFGRTAIVLFRVRYRCVELWKEAALLFLVDLGLFSALVARMQFTTTATVLFVAAIVSTCCWREEESDYSGGVFTHMILPAFLAVMGAAMRGQSGCLGFLFWAAAMVAAVLSRKGSILDRVKASKDMIVPALCSGLIALMLVAVHEFAYSSPEWSANRDLSRQLAGYTDYARSTYEQNPELYDSVGWDADLVWLTGNWFQMDERITADALAHINEGNNAGKENLLSNPLGTMKSRLAELGQPAPMAYVALLLCVGLFTVAGARHSSDLAVSWFVAAVTVALLVYLALKGRLPERAVYSIIMPATATLGSITARNWHICGGDRRPTLVASIICVITIVVLGIPTGGTGKIACLSVLVTAISLLATSQPAREKPLGVSEKRWHVVTRICLAFVLLFPCAAAIRQHGWFSEDYETMSTRQENIEKFYDYAELHDDQFFFYSDDARLTPQYVWQERWPDNQTAWGGWRYCYSWFADAMREAGFDGTPTSEDLLDDNVRFVSGSQESADVLLHYMRGLYGDSVDMELVDTLGNNINIYRFVRPDSSGEL